MSYRRSSFTLKIQLITFIRPKCWTWLFVVAQSNLSISLLFRFLIDFVFDSLSGVAEPSWVCINSLKLGFWFRFIIWLTTVEILELRVSGWVLKVCYLISFINWRWSSSFSIFALCSNFCVSTLVWATYCRLVANIVLFGISCLVSCWIVAFELNYI